MVKETALPSQNATHLQLINTATQVAADPSAQTSATKVGAGQTASPSPMATRDNNAVTNSESKDSESSSSQPPPETEEVRMVAEGIIKDSNDFYEIDQDQQPVAAKAAKTIVDVSTEPTDPQA